MNRGSAQNFMQIPVRGFRPEASPTPPANPADGQLWTDLSVSPAVVRWYRSGTSEWVAADGTSIPAGSITDSMVSATAAIALSKLAVDPLARANHTGTQAANTIANFDTAVRANRLDQFTVPTVNLDLNGTRVTNSAAPLNGSDLVTKTYVDNARAGISVKDPVRVVAQSNVTLASPGAAIDGVTLSTGDRFLAPLQSTATQNGIYIFNGAATAASRSSDADDTGDVLDGSMVAVAEGTDAGYQYIQTATASGVPGTWTQTWVVYKTGGQTYLAGTGLTLTGTTFSLTSPVALTLGGTGATTAAGARANLGATTKFAANLAALSAGATYTVTHNLGNTDVVAAFRTTADDRVIDFDWSPATTNTLSVYPDLAFASGAVRAVVIG